MLGFTAAVGLRGVVLLRGESLSRLRLGQGLCAIEKIRPRHRNVPAAAQIRASSSSEGSSGEWIVTSVETKLKNELSPRSLSVKPTFGDINGAHISIDVVSDAFRGLTMVKRQQLVYKAIWDEMQGPIHAVDRLTTSTPEEREA